MVTKHLQKPVLTDDMRVGTDVEAWKSAFQRNLFYILGRFPATATMNDKYLALAYSVRDCILDRWVKTSETYYRKRCARLATCLPSTCWVHILATISSTLEPSRLRRRPWRSSVSISRSF